METAEITKKPVAKKAPKAAPKAQGGLYAVFATGGKQYRAQVGDKIKIEVLNPSTSSGEAYKEGDTLTFGNVLLTDNGGSEITLGAPFVKDVTVTATLTKIARYKTVDVIKYKQKSRYFKKYGHRQPYFEVQIEKIG